MGKEIGCRTNDNFSRHGPKHDTLREVYMILYDLAYSNITGLCVRLSGFAFVENSAQGIANALQSNILDFTEKFTEMVLSYYELLMVFSYYKCFLTMLKQFCCLIFFGNYDTFFSIL